MFTVMTYDRQSKRWLDYQTYCTEEIARVVAADLSSRGHTAQVSYPEGEEIVSVFFPAGVDSRTGSE